ncbi:DUF1428 domain-containing protein [Devosia chinhatensis]|uniref:DUF1428 domain-containing protein n=1 Tax=Devosia chinhatensis TaxID=429727 RepID=A0A0F5FPI1_9HYPH|nr:DUF1428 family protein [Devosia chinhatensis]KKB10072.1 hypothetical protein VE26_09830 [Devosia chinhatensis]
MPFHDITIVPVRTERKAAYLAFSARIAEIYREHGALRVLDCWQSEEASDDADFHAADAMDDYAPASLPNMKRLAGADAAETVVVSVIEWPSREIRDRAVKTVATDPRIVATMSEEPVFDGGRVIAGGFEVALDLPGPGAESPDTGD